MNCPMYCKTAGGYNSRDFSMDLGTENFKSNEPDVEVCRFLMQMGETFIAHEMHGTRGNRKYPCILFAVNFTFRGSKKEKKNGSEET